MNILEWLKDKLGFGEDDFDDIELNMGNDSAESLMESLARSSKKRRSIDIDDKEQRESYVRECCEMISATNADVEAQKIEFQQITRRLMDLEEIESLPAPDKSKVRDRAKKVVDLERQENEYVRPATKITEAQYRDMEAMESTIPAALRKMKEDEEYQMLVKRDMNLLEGEKGAIAYQRKEERSKAKNARAFSFVTMFAAVMALILLFILKKAMGMDIRMGLVILAAVFAITLTVFFVLYQNAQIEIVKSNRRLNRTINIQNTVKIKYVNITNVLDYNYSKYKVMNSYELSYLWEKYTEEKAAREHDSEYTYKIEEARRDLYQILKHYHISDPSIWVYQPGVIVFEDESKELRHSLIIQRQRLKKGIDFESYNIENTKQELESLITDYPRYAGEILGIMACYKQ